MQHHTSAPPTAGRWPSDTRHSRLRRAVLRFLTALLPTLLLGNAAAGESVTPDSDSEPMIDATRRTLRTSSEWLAHHVDSWFGDKPFEEGGKVSDGRMSLSVFKREDRSTDFGLRFNARFRLPNAEKQTYLFLGRDDRRDAITDKPEAFSRQQKVLPDASADQAFLAGLGLSLLDSTDVRLAVSGGFKPYAQVRYRKPWRLGPGDRVDFRETLFWTVDDHVGATTSLSYERALSSTLAARWVTAGTITQKTRRLDWSSSLGAYKVMGKQRLLSLEALCNGTRGSGSVLTDYGMQVKWEQPIYRDWLLAEVIAGHFWPRQEATGQRTRAWALGSSLKILF
jgi:hypothetical protein